MLSTAFERDDAGCAGFRQIDRSGGIRELLRIKGSVTRERPCRKAAHEMHEKWYTGDAEQGRGTVCHQECVNENVARLPLSTQNCGKTACIKLLFFR